MDKSKINRINELAHFAKERELSAEELAERDALRREYIEAWRKSTIEVLENTYIVDDAGNKRPLGKRKINEQHK